MKLFHDLVEQEPNLNAEPTEAVRDTSLPNIPPPPVEIHRKTGTDRGHHDEMTDVLPYKSVFPVPSPGGPARQAGRPDRYLALLLPHTVCVLAFLGPVKVDALLVRDTVVFNEKPGVAFGESFWTVITDLDIRPAEAVVLTLKVRLKEYSEMVLTQFRQQFKDWKGSEVAYLGENRWAFSAIIAHEVVPPLCTPRTEDWVFPASHDGRLEASLDSLVAPTLATVGFNVTTLKSVVVIELQKANATLINFISDLLRRNDGARASSEMTGFQIQELIKKTTEEFQLMESRYPYELLIIGRMRAHEQLDVPDNHFLPHLEQMVEV
ncbi:hypothetical protein GHT06_021580 [Daphnia sinensis]|uniref:Uncharacterized protein n=1 Tax=Daphnia sinensis TaxID=1820382 RepID=A0AAD5L9N4_9CRUS|nr:hypothetical protein GHT06_021580 [Daphnia sinensis]